MKESQNKKILEFLQSGNKITQADAVDMFGCYRLSARISDLRELGYPIKTNKKVGKNRFGNICNYAEYELVKECM